MLTSLLELYPVEYDRAWSDGKFSTRELSIGDANNAIVIYVRFPSPDLLEVMAIALP